MIPLKLIALFLLVTVNGAPNPISSLPEGVSKVIQRIPYKESLGSALQEIYRKKRQIPDFEYSAYGSHLPYDTGRYHYPLRKKFDDRLSRAPYDDSILSHFSERRWKKSQEEANENPEEFHGFKEYPVRDLGISYPKRKKLYLFQNGETYPGVLNPSYISGRQFYDSEELENNPLYQTLRNMYNRKDVSYPMDWRDFDKNAYKKSVKSAINAFKKRMIYNDDNEQFEQIRKRGKRSVSNEPLQEEASGLSAPNPETHESIPKEAQPLAWVGVEDARKKRGSPLAMKNKRRNFQDDYLTREYFKQIAQSVDNKKKRLQQEETANDDTDDPLLWRKRTTDLENFLENPTVLHLAQEKLEEAEEAIIDEAEEELKGELNGEELDEEQARDLLSNSITRLNALENMQESLKQLELLQQQDIVRKRALDLSSGDRQRSDSDKKKRRKSMAQIRDDFPYKRKRYFPEWQQDLKDECPVFHKLINDCNALLQFVGEEEGIFMDSCLMHEVCYMTGASEDISQHECDATLSASLEQSCVMADPRTNSQGTGSMECRKAAGQTFEALSNDPTRYDDEAASNLYDWDPCLEELLSKKR